MTVLALCERGYLLVSRQANALDLANLAKELGNHVLVRVEGKVTDEEGVTLGAGSVAELLSAVVGASGGTLTLSRARLRGIESKGTALDIDLVHGLEGSLGLLVGLKVNVSEAARSLKSLVGDDSGSLETGAFGEGLVESVVVDAPAEVTDEKSVVLFLGTLLVLGLLDGSRSLLLSLTLLGILGLLLVRLLRIRVIGIVRVV